MRMGGRAFGRGGEDGRHNCDSHRSMTEVPKTCGAQWDGSKWGSITRRDWLKKNNNGGITHLPGTLELDDLVAILVNVYFLLQAVSSILDEDEQERADEPGKRVPFHRRVSPCAREALCRNEHAGCGEDVGEGVGMGMGEGGGGGGGGGGESKRGASSNVVEDEEGRGREGRASGRGGGLGIERGRISGHATI